MAGNDDAGDVAIDDLAHNFDLAAGGQLAHVGHFAGTEELDPLMGEIAEETGKGESGAVDGLIADGAIEALFAGNYGELKGALGLLEEGFKGDGFDDTWSGAQRHDGSRLRWKRLSLKRKILAEVELAAL